MCALFSHYFVIIRWIKNVFYCGIIGISILESMRCIVRHEQKEFAQSFAVCQCHAWMLWHRKKRNKKYHQSSEMKSSVWATNRTARSHPEDIITCDRIKRNSIEQNKILWWIVLFLESVFNCCQLSAILCNPMDSMFISQNDNYIRIVIMASKLRCKSLHRTNTLNAAELSFKELNDCTKKPQK